MQFLLQKLIFVSKTKSDLKEFAKNWNCEFQAS